MENGLNTILIISLVMVTGCLVIFLALLIQVLNIFKRILTKIELRIDNLSLTQEEIKLRILSFIEELLNKVKNYGRKYNKNFTVKKEGEKIYEEKD